MHKQELLDLHSTLSNVKDFLLGFEDVTEDQFSEYNEMGVTPSNDREPKSKHELAIYVLGDEIADALSESPMDKADKLSNRMEELADKARQQV